MQKYIPQILFIIFTALLTYYLNLDTKEIAYNITEPIPEKLSDADSLLFIQILEIENTGDISINDIKIKVNSVVDNFDLQKVADTDKFISINSKKGLQIEYPKLHPSAKFQILLKSHKGIINEDIRILHEFGKGVIKNNKDTLTTSLFFYVLLLFYIVIITLNFIEYYVYYNFYSYAARGGVLSFRKIFSSNKPFYLSQSKWVKLQDYAFEMLFNYSYLPPNPREWLEYQFINNEITKELVKNYNFNLILTKAFASFKEKVNASIIGSNHNLSHLIDLKKPESVGTGDWESIISIISKHYISHKYIELMNITRTAELDYIRNSTKPLNVDDTYWGIYQQKVEMTINYINFNESYFKFYDALVGKLKEDDKGLIPDMLWSKLKDISDKMQELNKKSK